MLDRQRLLRQPNVAVLVDAPPYCSCLPLAACIAAVRLLLTLGRNPGRKGQVNAPRGLWRSVPDQARMHRGTKALRHRMSEDGKNTQFRSYPDKALCRQVSEVNRPVQDPQTSSYRSASDGRGAFSARRDHASQRFDGAGGAISLPVLALLALIQGASPQQLRQRCVSMDPKRGLASAPTPARSVVRIRPSQAAGYGKKVLRQHVRKLLLEIRIQFFKPQAHLQPCVTRRPSLVNRPSRICRQQRQACIRPGEP